ncbi:ABC transporter permease [Azospirillum agricola]|uniref:ABC transporter permease n=1 Tax=Azospirillum agricola TaxID=1720247 RepID=UPI000A0F3A7C|nr:iron ABC transporter permease [Azospirillum agricola]SMH39768.1 iron(III) transport system permease protein [Azospirillum lipoferum]
MRPRSAIWLALGWVGFALLPWFAGSGTQPTLAPPAPGPAGSALIDGLTSGRWWLLPVALPLLLALAVTALPSLRARQPAALLAGGAFGLAWVAAQGFAIGLDGWAWGWLGALFGPLPLGQGGFGAGAALTALSFLFLMTNGFAGLGFMKGDRFTAGAIGLVLAAIAAFVFLPVGYVLSGAGDTGTGGFSAAALWTRLAAPDVWRLSCLTEAKSCGVVWNSVFLAVMTGIATTLLGLAFALVAVRTGFRAKKLLRVLTVLPIITPPFVISLAVILLFGRNGTVTLAMADWFGIPVSRWIYGLPGVLLTQTLAFTPISFLVMIGVVQGIGPSLEEAAQTLRASRWVTFRTVTWPLMRPGVANAFLISFIESLADFGNPLILGGNYEVLSTKIYFAVVGAQNDPGRAAALGIILLCLCLGAFWVQRQWLGKKSYATVGGKGDNGIPSQLPRGVKIAAYATALPWAAFTFVLYGLILFGGFTENWGRNNSLTLRHYLAAFDLSWGPGGLIWSGRAWGSLFTTIEVAALSAPLTAAVGLLTAYLLVRQSFKGRGAFEFLTMLSFAIPGTVIGISYILAFNQPPIELTGTVTILIVCFVFRNMPVSIRAGVAAMSQIDRSLDECSLTLGAGSVQTIRRVILPLLRPAIVASLVYSFVRAITSISAVIFLVSPKYELATAYIVGRVEQGDFGLAIAYSSALIVLMSVVIALIQFAVGERRIGRRTATPVTLQEKPV